MYNLPHIMRAKAVLLAMQRVCWDQGEAIQVCLEMKDWETMILLARQILDRSLPDGRPGIITPFDGDTVTDPCCCGQGLHKAYLLTRDAAFRDAYERLLEWVLEKAPRSENGTLYHLVSKRQIWADSMYMLPPLLVYAGYPDEAVRQFDGCWDALYNPERGLLRTIWDDDAGEYARPIHRGVGNGFAIAGAARVLDLMPADRTDLSGPLAEKARHIIDVMWAHRPTDGAFQNALEEDVATFTAMNAAQVMAHSIYRGLRAGWLDRSYEPMADELRRSMLACVDSYGFVQRVCNSPTYQKSGTSPEGQVFFLLMEIAYMDYMQVHAESSGNPAGDPRMGVGKY